MLVSSVQQSESAICSHKSPLLYYLPIWISTKHLVNFPVLYSRFSLVTYFIDSTPISTPVSQFMPPPGVHMFVLYVLSLSYANKIIYVIFLDSTYMY